MSKLILKAIPANATNATADQTLGYIDTTGSTQRVSVKAQPKTMYRLVDAKTGEVIKNQTVLRQGKHLLVTVDGVNAVDLDNFFPDDAANATAPVDSPSYLVDTGAAGAHSYGVVTSQTPVEVSANGMSVLWTPGMTALPVADPVAFGAPVVAAVSGGGGMWGLLGAVGVAAAAGGGGNGSGAGSKPAAKITGSAFKAEVADNTGLVVEAFDSTGKSRGKANVGADGKYSLTLDDPSYKGSLVLKMYDGLPDDGKTPKFYDEATGEVKDFTKPLYAVVNYGGDGKDITVNVTPLTNLAATVAGVVAATNKMTVPVDKTADQVVKEANAMVAQKFGLNEADLTSADVQTTKSDKANAYGVALAVISKMEQSKSQDDVANQFKDDSNGAFTTSLKEAVKALKNDAGTNNDYLKNIDTSKLDKVSDVASDTTAPVLVTSGTKANTSSDGSKVYLHFDSELSKNTADVNAFTVSVTTKAIVGSGTDTITTPAISSVAIDGNDVVLTLATKIAKGQTVTVSYTDPTPNVASDATTNDLLAVQDLAGNDAANISATTVVNNVTDVKPVITVKAGQSFNYDENQVITEKTVDGNTVYTKPTVATVDMGDGSATPTKFRFADSQSSVSSDGWYNIDNSGKISLTSAGLGAGKASNDFETKIKGGNALVYGVQAGDDAGNWSVSTNITLNVNNVTPEAPTVSAPVSFTVTEDVQGNLLFDKAAFANVDSGNTLAVTLFVEGNSGTLFYDDKKATAATITVTNNDDGSSTFTGASSALNVYFSTAGNLSYQDDTNFNGTRVLDITVSDESGKLSSSTTSKIKVLAVNDAPLTGGAASLTAIAEDNTTATGATVKTLFVAYFDDSADAVANGSSANTLAGVAIKGNAATDAQGVWQWTSDGSNWTSIATSGLADASALYLAADTKLRFVPTKDYNGTPGALTARLVESSATSLTNGATTDVSTNGGATAYSAKTINLSTSITAVNDPPVRTAGTDLTLNINEDSASTATSLGLGAYTYSAGGGADETSGNSAQTLSYKFTNIPSSIALYKADGTTLVTTSTTGLTLTDLQGLKYKTVADANDSTAHNLTWTVTDSGTGTNSITETISVKVNAVNDAPSSADKTFTIMEDGNQTFAATDFGFTDASDTPANSLSAVIITNLPTAGSLKFNNVDVTKDQSIAAADLGKLVYTPAANGSGESYASIGFKVQDNGGTANDGKNTSVIANTLTFNVTAVNDAPTLTVTASDKTFTEGNGLEVQGAAVSGLFSGATFSDVESNNIASITLKIDGLLDDTCEVLQIDGDKLTLGDDDAVDSSLDFSTHQLNYSTHSTWVNNRATDTTVVLSKEGGFTLVEAKAILESVGYQNTYVDNPTAGVRHIAVTQITDTGSGDSPNVNSTTYNNFIADVTVSPVNDAPVNLILDSTVSVDANIPTYQLDGSKVAYRLKLINGLFVKDSDVSADATISVKLSVQNGSLAHTTFSGVNFTDTSASSFTASGKKEDINSWLDDVNVTLNSRALTYTPNEGYTGSDTLTMLTDDGGNSGGGGAQTATNQMTLNVTDTHAPVLLKAETSTDGQSIVLTYDEALDSSNMAVGSQYSLAVTDGDNPVTVDVNSATTSGRTVTLSLSQAIEIQQVVKLTYTDPDGDTAATVQDIAGNDAASLTDQVITIKVPDLVKPTVTTSAPLTYTENQTADAVVGTVTAKDNVGVTGYQFAANNSTTSADGFFTIANDGKVRITAAGAAATNDFEAGTNSFTYAIQATDGTNWSTAANVTLNLTNVNEAPTLTSISTLSGFTEDTYSTITYQNLLDASDESDVDAGDTAKFLITGVTTGTLQKLNDDGLWDDVVAGTTTVAAGEQLQWKPAADANGSGLNAFTVKAQDAGGLTSDTSIQVKADVSAVNDIPVRAGTSATAISVNEDSANSTAVSLGLSGYSYGPGGGTDEASQTLSYSITNIPTSVSLWKADGVTQVFTSTTGLTQADIQGLMYKTIADANNSTAQNITWTVTDSGTGSNSITESLSVIVAPVNDAPVRSGASAAAIIVNEDSANITPNGLGLLGAYTYGPGGGADEASQTLTYTITNIPPSITLWKSGGSVAVANGATLTLSELQGLVYKTVANANNATPANISWTVTDNGPGSSSITETLSVTVAPVNDPPVRSGSTAMILVNEDAANITAVSLGLSGYSYTNGGGADEASQTLTYSISNIPPTVTLWKADGVTQVFTTTTGLTQADIQGLKYKTIANANNATPANITVTVKDNGGGATDTFTDNISVIVNPVNDMPTRSGMVTALVVNEDSANGTAASLGLSGITYGPGGGTDEASQTLTYSITNIPSSITLWKADGVTQVFTTTTGLTQADIQGLMYKTISDANNSTAQNITWTVKDNGSGVFDTLTVNQSVTVNAVNDVPVRTGASAAAISVNEDFANSTAVSLGLSGYSYGPGGGADEASQTLTYSITNFPGSITLWKADGVTQVFTYTTGLTQADIQGLKYKTTANANNVTPANITWTVTDSGPGSSSITETLSVTVNPVNDVPVRTGTSAAAISVNEDFANSTAVSLGLSGYSYGPGGGMDESSQTLTYTITNIPGSITLWKADGVTQVFTTTTGLTQSDIQGLKYKTVADANNAAPANISWTVTDSGTGSNSIAETLSVTVSPVNDVPVRTGTSAAAISVNEDSTNSTAVSLGLSGYSYGPGGGTDEASQTLTYSITNIPGSITLWKADGVTQVFTTTTGLTQADIQGLKYKTVADANNATPANITWTVTDSGTGSSSITETLSVTVNPLNDAPTITTPSGALAGANSNVAYSIAGGFTIADVDAGSSTVQVNFQVLEGAATDGDVLNYGTLPADVTLVGGAYGTNHVYSFQGTISALNAWMLNTGFLKFTSTSASNVTASIKTTVSDLGNTGTGGILTANGTTLNVNVVSDSTPPVFQNAVTNTAGDQITLTYNEALSATTAATGAFAVSVAGSNRNVTGVSVSGSTVVLTLASAVTNGQTVTVGYTDPTANNDVNAVQDIAGNDAVTLAATTAVTNNVPDTTAPIRQSAATNSLGTQVILTYSEALSASTASPGDFLVKANGTDRTISSVSVSGNTVVLTLASPALLYGEGVAVGYVDPTGNNDVNAVQDLAGNDAATFSLVTVTNNVVDAIAPTFQSAATNQYGQIILTYNEALSATTAATTAFAVTVGGAPRTVSAAQVIGSTVLLTLSTAVASGDTVTVSYTDPSANNDSNAVQDSAGNDAATMVSAANVVNNMPDTVPPVFQSAVTNTAGTQITLTYDENLSATTAATNAFSVSVDSVTDTVSVISVSGRTAVLTLATPVLNGQTVTVGYTDPTSGNDVNAIQDISGNDAFTLSASTSVTNNVPDITGPLLKEPVMDFSNGGIQLRFNELLDTTAAANVENNITITADGVLQTGAYTVFANYSNDILALRHSAISSNFYTYYQSIKISYTDPSVANDTVKVLQDAVGNDAASFNIILDRVPHSGSTVTGTNITDYIMGGDNNDTIIGGQGNDTMWGYQNFDIGSATSDNDVFKWNSGDAGASGATDTIKDFTKWNGTSGDKLSIYGLLSGFTLASSPLEQWVKTIATGQTVNGVFNSTVMTIDVDGPGSGTVTQVIQFEGINLLSGVSGTLAQQLASLKTSGVFI